MWLFCTLQCRPLWILKTSHQAWKAGCVKAAHSLRRFFNLGLTHGRGSGQVAWIMAALLGRRSSAVLLPTCADTAVHALTCSTWPTCGCRSRVCLQKNTGNYIDELPSFITVTGVGRMNACAFWWTERGLFVEMTPAGVRAS